MDNKELEDAIYARIPPGWGKDIAVVDAWYPLLERTYVLLEAIDPNFEIHQIKEKFNGLRFYAEYTGTSQVESVLFANILRQAEAMSLETCMSCGEMGAVPMRKGYSTGTYHPQCAPSDWSFLEKVVD